MTSMSSQSGLLPTGLSDVLYPDAKIQAKTIEKLLDVFSNFGYLRVKPPLVEYEETLLSDGPGIVLKDSTFRIMDPMSQKMMALRSDVTAQISRIASTRLPHLPRPLRLSYSGDVLRVKGDSFNMERQKTQVGAELIGSKSAFVDAEVILICLEALKSIDINRMTLDLNLPFLREYFLSNLSHSMKEKINEAIDRKDQKTLKSLKFDNSETLIQFMECTGDDLHATKYLSRLKLDQKLTQIRNHFLKVIKIIKRNKKSIKIFVDPLENRGFKYHTGLTFTVFSELLKGEIAKGGRYKTMSNETATGCTIYTEKIYNKSNPKIKNELVYIPYLNMDEAESIIKKGYDIVFGSNSEVDFNKEALELRCNYILKNKIITKIEH